MRFIRKEGTVGVPAPLVARGKSEKLGVLRDQGIRFAICMMGVA